MLFATAACSGGQAAIGPDEVARFQAGASERAVLPAHTDPRLADFDRFREPHLVVRPTRQTAPRGLLVVLPGTNGLPEDHRWLLRSAALEGRLAIGLRYANAWPMSRYCNEGLDARCHGDFREMMLRGGTAQAARSASEANGDSDAETISLPPEQGIENRLLQLLVYLNDRFPDEGWDLFLDFRDGPAGADADAAREAGDDGAAPAQGVVVRWERIELSGYSLGAGMAAYAAQEHAVARVGMYSGPADRLRDGRLPAWLARPSATPAARYFGFIHARDEITPLNDALSNWRRLGLGRFGGPLVADRRSLEDLRRSHMLISRRPLAGRDRLAGLLPEPMAAALVAEDGEVNRYPAHNATVRDRFTPRDAQALPEYREVWRYVSLRDRGLAVPDLAAAEAGEVDGVGEAAPE